MHYLFTGILPMCILIISTTRSAPSSNTVIQDRLTPDEYRRTPDEQENINIDLNDENAAAAVDDDDDDNVDESRESICEAALNMIIHHHDISNLNPLILLYYCPQYEERLAWIQEKHDQLLKEGSTRKQSISTMPNDHNKQQALRGRELNKQITSRFIRKQMS